jgi:PadR family transcriptional regulator, regulatory protein PadR
LGGNKFENPDLLPGTLYMMILRTLNQGPLHGYAIAKHIHAWSKGDLEIEDGSLYPALNRMLLKGWLKAEWGVTENNRKARFYRLTPAGKKQLESESDAFNKMVRAIQLIMRTS